MTMGGQSKQPIGFTLAEPSSDAVANLSLSAGEKARSKTLALCPASSGSMNEIADVPLATLTSNCCSDSGLAEQQTSP